MAIATAVTSGLLAALLIYTAARKLSHRPAVVHSYRLAGVPEPWLNPLAVLLLAAAAGLLVGLAWAPLGITAAGGLVAYFVIAVTFHLRAGDQRHLLTPVLMLALAITALALHLTR
jgi:DoxX-like family